MEIREHWHVRIQAGMEANNTTPKEVAEETSMSAQLVLDIANGVAGITSVQARELERELGITLLEEDS